MIDRWNIQTRTTEPVSSNDIVSVYGASNRMNIENSVSTLFTKSTGTENFSKNNTGTIVMGTGKNQIHIKRRTRVNSHRTTIIKGQKWDVMFNGAIPNKIKLCVGWDIMDQLCEVDVSIFMLTQTEKVPSDEWFIFWGQNVSPDNSVTYKSNDENLCLPDDTEITVELNRVRNDIQKISLCATIYESIKRNKNFGFVKNMYARILDDSGNELCYIPIVDLPNEVTSLVIGELYRHKNFWKFSVVAAGYKRELAQFCNIYGIELE